MIPLGCDECSFLIMGDFQCRSCYFLKKMEMSQSDKGIYCLIPWSPLRVIHYILKQYWFFRAIGMEMGLMYSQSRKKVSNKLQNKKQNQFTQNKISKYLIRNTKKWKEINNILNSEIIAHSQNKGVRNILAKSGAEQAKTQRWQIF